MDKKFEEIKIKMVMKLRGVTRASAVRLIKLGKEAAEQKELERRILKSNNVGSAKEDSDADGFISAEEFFGNN